MQSFYELDFAQAGVPFDSPVFRWWTAEGTDHVLLLLLLPSPLTAIGKRWAGITGGRSSLIRTLKIVTAFTIGHSSTLALAAFGLLHVPSRPIEVLIAISILVSAIHALRPMFPGKEARIATFFGLIHGLAFASRLGALGLGRWERVAGILASTSESKRCRWRW
jgi:hypothetical protein